MRRNPHLLLVLVVLIVIHRVLLVDNSCLAQDKASKIDELMALYQNYDQFNGSVLVTEKGKVIYKKGFGSANMEWNIPNQPDTKFRLGSITKQFTAMLVMQLVEQGKLRLNGKITDYLPEYPKKTGDRITIHHLLTHTSGIPNYTALPNFMSQMSREPYAPTDFLKKFFELDLEFDPGSKFNYSNSGYFLLGVIIEKVTGLPYEKVLQERILDPLNMKNTGYDHHSTITVNRAAGYQRSLKGYENAAYLDMSLPYAAGSLYSTVEDLYFWDQALYIDKLLSKKSRDQMFQPYLSGYAYGWIIGKIPLEQSRDSVASISHGGGINGFNTLIVRLPDDRHLIVLLNNTGGAKLDEISRGVTNILYGKPYKPPRKSIAQMILKALEENNVEAAIKKYREMKASQGDLYDFGENELNTLGYQLLGMKRVKDAIEVFKLNIEAYPDAFNPYDSLAEAYMINGDKELAIKNYAKSLELNPKNTNAIEMLKRINESK